jgi:hypothetical protein
MGILDKFKIDTTAFAALAENDLFQNAGSTRLKVGKRVPYTGTINGISVPCYVTLNEARLTRLSMLEQQQISTQRNYYLATGIMKGVKMDVELMIDGSPIHITDFLHHIAQEASGSKMSRDEFMLTARRIGFNFEDGMPLFFQQFGANWNSYTKAIDAFEEAGAKSVYDNIKNPKRIVSAFAHEEGVPVTEFELGTVDRSKSPRNAQFPDVPQGFLNLLDAQVDQFTRILKLRKESHLLKAAIENQNDWSQKKIKEAAERADELNKMSRQWMSSWSGAQQRIENDKGTYTLKNMYDPVYAPCGRFTMVTSNGNVEVDLWSNSAKANVSTNSSAPEEDF